MTLAETIAEEIFRTIERERRIIKDDLIHAIEKCLTVKPAARFTRISANLLDTQDQITIAKVPTGTIKNDPEPKIRAVGGPYDGRYFPQKGYILEAGGFKYTLAFVVLPGDPLAVCDYWQFEQMSDDEAYLAVRALVADGQIKPRTDADPSRS